MGKTRLQRRKLHAPAVKKACERTHAAPSNMDVAISPPAASILPSLPGTTTEAGVFAGVQIPAEALRQHLPDFDTCSVRSGASARSTKSALRGHTSIKKRDKRKLRREVFLQKLDTVMESLRSARAEKRRRATPVVGDMRPLAAALPDADVLKKQAAARREAALQRRKPSEKRRGMPKRKQRQKQFLDDIAHFQRVLEHPIYQEDPEGIVTEHVHQWVIKDAQGMNA